MAHEEQKNDYALESSDEAWRLAVMHQAYKEAQNGKLVLAPLDLTAPSLTILDSGTSDGTWLLDLRDELNKSGHAHSYVGTDIAKERFPTSVPSDVSFSYQNVNHAWPSSQQSAFDLVHQRLGLAGCGGGTGVQDAVNRLCGLVKPGGWIQLCEAEEVVGDDDGPAMHHFLALLSELFALWGCGIEFPGKLKGWIEEQGFVNTQSMLLPIYLGAKNPDKELGRKTARATVPAVRGLVQVAKSMPGFKSLTPDELDSLPDRLLAELDSQGGYYPMRLVWGQKPAS